MLETGGKARAERTMNMELMSVTAEVFQLEMSSLNPPKPWKSPHMFVIDETTQSEMGPYFIVVDSISSWNSWTAVLREVAFVKVCGGGGVGSSVGGGGVRGGDGGGIASRQGQIRWRPPAALLHLLLVISPASFKFGWYLLIVSQ